VFGNLLVMRWVLLNIIFVMLAGLAYRYGMMTQAWQGDTTWFTSTILAFVAIGFLMTSHRIYECSKMLDSIRSNPSGRVKEYMLSKRDLVAKESLRAKIDARVRPVEWLAYCLVTLGFLAIIWGMKEGLYEIANSPINDASGAVRIVQVLVQHFVVALWPTITGIAGYLFLSFNIVLLQGGYDRLYTQILERAE